MRIFDTTLRDGEQTPGVSLSLEQKLEIAGQLDKLGVDIIEAGFPVASDGERSAVSEVAKSGLNSQVCGLSRVILKDIDACLDCDVDMVHTFVSTSDVQRLHTIEKSREEVVELAVGAVEYIKDHGALCMFSAMDATRTDIDYLTVIHQAVEQAGCDVINVPDTVGVMVPSSMYRLIERIRETVSVPLDVHCHNDYGLAVANSTAAVEAGANQVQVTINGLGERAGNADLAETVMILHTIYGAQTNIHTEYLFETGFSTALLEQAAELSRRVFETLGCRHLARIDWIVGPDEQLWFLEVNTIPGFTSHSLVPKAAAKVGIPFDELVERLVRMAMEDHS